MKLNGNLTLPSGGSGEIRNAVVERLATAPTVIAAEAGRIYYNTTSATYFYNTGSAWAAFATGGNTASLQTEINAIETSLGSAINSDGTFNSGAFSGFGHVINPASYTAALSQLDGAITTVANTAAASLDALNDVTLSNRAAKDVLYYDNSTSQWRNAPAGSVSGVQAYDADLTAIAALTSNGITVRTGSGTYDVRSIALDSTSQASANFSIANADGVAGNPTIALTGLFANLASASGAGFVSITGTAVNKRTITGTAGSIVVSDGAGSSGNPTISLAAVTDSGTGSFKKFTSDTFGRITGTTNVVAADIRGLVDSAYVLKAGDSMEGTLNMGNNPISGLAAGTNATDAVNKGQMDAAVAGLSWKNPVRAATTANITLSGTQTVDDVVLVAGDRVLVKNQTLSQNNGIYVVAAGTWARSIDFDALAPIDEINAAAVFVTDGTTNGDYGFTVTSTVINLGTDPIVFAQFTGASSIIAGIGLKQTGNQIDVNLGAGIVELPGDEVGIDLYGNDGLILTTNGTTSSTAAAAKLKLLLDGSTLAQSATGIKVASSGITATELHTSIAGAGLTGGNGTALAVNVDSATIEISSDILRVKDGGISNAKLALPYISVEPDSNLQTTTINLGSTLQVKGSGGITTSATAGKITITLSAGLSALNDVTVTAATAGDILVNNGSEFVNKKAYFLYEAVSATTSHSVAHNLNCKYCNVTVVDAATDEVIIPESIKFDTANSLTVTCTPALNCKVIVMGV